MRGPVLPLHGRFRWMGIWARGCCMRCGRGWMADGRAFSLLAGMCRRCRYPIWNRCLTRTPMWRWGGGGWRRAATLDFRWRLARRGLILMSLPIWLAFKESMALKVGSKAPELKLTDEAGKSFKLSSFKGKTVV